MDRLRARGVVNILELPLGPRSLPAPVHAVWAGTALARGRRG